MTKAAGRPRFDLDALRDDAGEKVFGRGEAYWREGRVRLLSVDRTRVLAQVEGSEDYRTSLTGRGLRIGGECSCPAFEDWGTCKHMVAVAFAANAAPDGGADADAFGRIRAYLATKGVEALVEMICELAEQNPALFRKLDLAAASHGDHAAAESRLRKAIDAATRADGYIDYRAAARWAGEVDGVLDAVGQLVSAGQAASALTLAEHAIDRIERALDNVDDADDHGNGLLDHAATIHLAAAQAMRPEPAAFARRLFDRETAGLSGAFDGAAWRYADVLGETGAAEYRRLAAAAWDALPPRLDRAADADWDRASHYRLRGILDRFAEQAGDIDARIALRTKDRSSPAAYLDIAGFCLSAGRDADALRWAEDGLWLFEDHAESYELAVFAAELLAQAGRPDDAEARLRPAFERAPSIRLYRLLREVGGAERAIQWLDAQLAKGASRLADLLVHVLMEQQAFDAAWAATRRFETRPETQEVLARASEESHPRAALDVYVAAVDRLVVLGTGRSYGQAAALLGRMATLRDADAHAAYVADLRARFQRRRNFIKLLDQARPVAIEDRTSDGLPE